MPIREEAVSSGQMIHPVVIEKKVDSKDDSQFPIETWSALTPHPKTLMARFHLSATEQFRAEQVGTLYDTVWMMPYRTDMDPDLLDIANYRRLVFGNRTHNITGGKVIGNKVQIRIETVASGNTT